MSPDERAQARAAMLQQLSETRQAARSTSAMGANFLLGVSVGTLMNLRALLPHAEVAALATQVKAEFAALWPEINPAFTHLLDLMISHPKETPHD